MFADAVARAIQFTRPVIVSTCFYDGTVDSGMAAFVPINDAGWIVTAAHIFQPTKVSPDHQKEIAAYEASRGKGGKGKVKRTPSGSLIIPSGGHVTASPLRSSSRTSR